MTRHIRCGLLGLTALILSNFGTSAYAADPAEAELIPGSKIVPRWLVIELDQQAYPDWAEHFGITPEAPPEVVPINLASGTLAEKPTEFQWEALPTASEYQVYIENISTETILIHENFQATDLCVLDTCALSTSDITFAPLNNHLFTVRGFNDVGLGPWSSETIFSIEVPNSPPLAEDDSASVIAGASVSIDILTNDIDSDGTLEPSSVVITQAAAHGIVVLQADDTVLYTHTGGESANGTDTFRYTVADDDADLSNVADVVVTIDTPVVPNIPPVAKNDSSTVLANTSVSIDLLTNDVDTDGTLNQSSVVITQAASYGNALLQADGTVLYTHTGGASANGTDTFSYAVADDDTDLSNVAEVVVTIDTPPVAQDDSATVVAGASISIEALTNDTDSYGTLDPTTLVVTVAALHGDAEVQADGTVLYTHNGGESVIDSFSYTVADDSGNVSVSDSSPLCV